MERRDGKRGTDGIEQDDDKARGGGGGRGVPSNKVKGGLLCWKRLTAPCEVVGGGEAARWDGGGRARWRGSKRVGTAQNTDVSKGCRWKKTQDGLHRWRRWAV